MMSCALQNVADINCEIDGGHDWQPWDCLSASVDSPTPSFEIKDENTSKAEGLRKRGRRQRSKNTICHCSQSRRSKA